MAKGSINAFRSAVDYYGTPNTERGNQWTNIESGDYADTMKVGSTPGRGQMTSEMPAMGKPQGAHMGSQSEAPTKEGD